MYGPPPSYGTAAGSLASITKVQGSPRRPAATHPAGLDLVPLAVTSAPGRPRPDSSHTARRIPTLPLAPAVIAYLGIEGGAYRTATCAIQGIALSYDGERERVRVHLCAVVSGECVGTQLGDRGGPLLRVGGRVGGVVSAHDHEAPLVGEAVQDVVKLGELALVAIVFGGPGGFTLLM